MTLADHLNPIEDVARDMAKYARCVRKAGEDPKDVVLQRELLISMFTQLEVLKMRCGMLQSSKAFKELGT